MSEFVFILGAGASRQVGGPLMADFFEKAERLFRRPEGYLSDFDRIWKAISALQIVHSKSDLDLYNLESVFGALEMARLVQKLPGFEPAEIDSAISSLRRLIARTSSGLLSSRFPKGRSVHRVPIRRLSI